MKSVRVRYCIVDELCFLSFAALSFLCDAMAFPPGPSLEKMRELDALCGEQPESGQVVALKARLRASTATLQAKGLYVAVMNDLAHLVKTHVAAGAA